MARRLMRCVHLAALLPAATTAFTAGSSGAAFASSIRDVQDSMIAAAKLADPSARWTFDEHSKGRAVIVEEGHPAGA